MAVAEDILKPDRRRPLSSRSCVNLEAKFVVALDKFERDRFAETVSKQGFPDSRTGSSVCFSELGKDGDYHIHFWWSIDEEDVTLIVRYHKGGMTGPPGDAEPYAEQFMGWLGHFFQYHEAHCHVTADFSFPLKSRRSRFPLPVKVPIAQDFETEIDGVSVRLPSRPEGMHLVRLTQDEKKVFINLHGQWRVTFAEWNVDKEVDRLSRLAFSITEENK